jgi:hypothetical protein
VLHIGYSSALHVRNLIVWFIGKANPENASHDDLAILYQSLLPQLPQLPSFPGILIHTYCHHDTVEISHIDHQER